MGKRDENKIPGLARYLVKSNSVNSSFNNTQQKKQMGIEMAQGVMT